jgi:hypothetical protein
MTALHPTRKNRKPDSGIAKDEMYIEISSILDRLTRDSLIESLSKILALSLNGTDFAAVVYVMHETS